MRKLYPQGKAKAFQLTYDDGVLQDVPLVQLLNRYGIKATFNLNSQLMMEEFTWTHPNGMVVQRLSPERAQGLYDGHEIASHTLTHPYMQGLPKAEILRQMGQDRENLQKLFGREILGFAVPFDYFSQEIADCARELGFAYARTVDAVDDIRTCPNLMVFNPNTHFKAPDFMERFHKAKATGMFYFWGHSYELIDDEELWNNFEKNIAEISADPDVEWVNVTDLAEEVKQYL